MSDAVSPTPAQPPNRKASTDGSTDSLTDRSPKTPRRWLVQVCQHRSCLRNRSDEVLMAFRDHQSAQIAVAASGCMGQCSSGPTVRILPDDTWYCRLRPEDVAGIVEQHLRQGQPVAAHLHPRFHPPPED